MKHDSFSHSVHQLDAMWPVCVSVWSHVLDSLGCLVLIEICRKALTMDV